MATVSLPQRVGQPDGVTLPLAIVAAACAVLPLMWIAKLAMTAEPQFPDFFGLWTHGRYVLTHVPATVYDDDALRAFQVGLGMPDGFFPYPYPPWALLVLAPLGALPYDVARIAWLGVTFGAYVAVLGVWRWDRLVVLLLFAAPATAVGFLVGQNGFLTAALMLGGLRLLPVRPLLAGALLAAIGYKPQFAIMVPFALLFGGHWRAILGAALATIGLTLASIAAFGPEIWPAWLGYMQHQGAALSAGRNDLLDMMPTVTSAVLLLGGGVTAAHLAQAAGVLAALAALWRVRGRHDPEAQAVLPLATLLATPYAFAYDLPMCCGALLAVIAARLAAGGRFAPLELPLLLACIAMPAILPVRSGAACVMIPALFAVACWAMSRRDALHARPLSNPVPA